MEWIIATAVAIVIFASSALILIQKLKRFVKPLTNLSDQLSKLEEARVKIPEITKQLSALGDDPAVHVARRLALKKAENEKKQERQRRLRSRVFR